MRYSKICPLLSRCDFIFCRLHFVFFPCFTFYVLVVVVVVVSLFMFLWFYCLVYVTMCCLRGVINDNNNNNNNNSFPRVSEKSTRIKLGIGWHVLHKLYEKETSLHRTVYNCIIFHIFPPSFPPNCKRNQFQSVES